MKDGDNVALTVPLPMRQARKTLFLFVVLVGILEGEKEMILGGNAMNLYRIG